MITFPFTDLPGNNHKLAPGKSVRVTGSDLYRMSWADILQPATPQYQELATAYPAGQAPTEPLGIAGLESQEHSLTWIGSPAVISGILDGTWPEIPWAQLNAQGGYAGGWMNADSWAGYVPCTTWTPHGGILSQYPHPDGNGQVIIYETTGLPSLLSAAPAASGTVGPVPIVTFHCTRCHAEDDRARRIMSACPRDRQAAAEAARRHVAPGRCTPAPAARYAQTPEGCLERPLNADNYRARSSCNEVRQAREATTAWHRQHTPAGT